MIKMDTITMNALIAISGCSDLRKFSDEGLDAAYDMVAKPFCNSLMDAASRHELQKWECELVRAVYWKISDEQDRRFKEQNEGSVRAMFDRYFKGKTWEQIKGDEDLYDLWGSYSDYHKDVYGYRPHGIVCGEYVKPW